MPFSDRMFIYSVMKIVVFFKWENICGHEFMQTVIELTFIICVSIGFDDIDVEIYLLF